MKNIKKRKKVSFTNLIFSSKILLLFLFFLSLFFFSGTAGIKRFIPGKGYFERPISIEEVVNVPPPTPFAWTVEKADGGITKIALPPDPAMSTRDELFDAMNSYRSTHGVNQLKRSDLLCSIAQNRAAEQVANGGLDGHAGFDKYAGNQEEFSRMGEVLFGGVQPQYGVHIVEYGWDRSLTGHREAIRNPDWQYGCGGIAGYFAVFIFGTP